MANDPNRDVLPVKEAAEKFSTHSERIDFALLSKCRRSELEDRYLRLYEENNQLKILTHVQEGKIKKLGAKLLRVLGDKKQGVSLSRRNLEDPAMVEQLQMKVLELQHENYSLKDKITVLRQQLASHSRQHMAAHRSPVRIHRHTSVPNINEGSIALSNRQQSSELELGDDEAHIAVLNQQNKSLTQQLESLRKELEESLLANQKNRVGENIELIKIRRQNKQLETALRCSQLNVKHLQEERERLHKENEEALQIIAENQSQLIDCQSKLDDALKSHLEWHEMKQTIDGLTGERDILKERCDALLKTVGETPKDSANVKQLEKLLAVEKSKTTALRCELRLLQQATSVPLKSNGLEAQDASAPVLSEESPYAEVGAPKQTPVVSATPQKKLDWAAEAERVTLQRDTEYLREMLRAETQRCDFLENQVRRFQQESEMKEVRYMEVFQQRDLLFKLLNNGYRHDSAKSDEDSNESASEGGDDIVKMGGTYTKNSPVLSSSHGSPVMMPSSTNNTQGMEPVPAPRTRTIQSKGSATEAEQDEQLQRKDNFQVSEEEKSVPIEAKAIIVKSLETAPPLKIQVSILWLQLDGSWSLFGESSIKALYVDFALLGTSSTEFETPQAVPKPAVPTEKCLYHYTVDVLWSEDLTASLKKAKDEGGDVLVFNIVSEPPGDESQVECTVVGTACIGFQQFSSASEVQELLLPISDVTAAPQCIGALAVQLGVPTSLIITTL